MKNAEASLAKIRLEHGNDKTKGGALIRFETAIEPFVIAVDRELNDKAMSLPDVLDAYTLILSSCVYALAQQLDENEETKTQFIQQIFAKSLVNALANDPRGMAL